MGTLDTNGTVNVYFEDSTLNIGAAPDVDDNGRFVARHSLLDGAWAVTHGFTSMFGGRHVEYYNNVFQITTPNRNMAGRFFWFRAGTGIFADNVVNSTDWGYGHSKIVWIGDNTSPTSYPQPRQPGWGHNGSADVRDPIYVWNHSGNAAYTYEIVDVWTSNVQLNRELFVNSGPKPGYSKYAYPHPLRGGSTGGSTAPPAASLPAPANLRIVQ